MDDDLSILGACVGGGQNALQKLDHADYSRGTFVVFFM